MSQLNFPKRQNPRSSASAKRWCCINTAKLLKAAKTQTSRLWLGMYPDPNVWPLYGKSLYKPYIMWVFMGYSIPKNPIREHKLIPAPLEAAALDLVPRLEDEVLNGHDGTGGATALHYAAAAGYADLCWELLETPHFFVLNEQDCQVWRFQTIFFVGWGCCQNDGGSIFKMYFWLGWSEHESWNLFLGRVKWKKASKQTNCWVENKWRGIFVHIYFVWGGGEVKKTCT